MAYADYVLYQRLHFIELQVGSSNRGSTRTSGLRLSKIAPTRQPFDLGTRARKSTSHLKIKLHLASKSPVKLHECANLPKSVSVDKRCPLGLGVYEGWMKGRHVAA